MKTLAMFALLTIPAFGWADTVVFKNGQELEGTILEQDDTTILLEVEFGTMRVSKDKVERIDPGTPNKVAKAATERQSSGTSTAKSDAGGDARAQAKEKIADAAKSARSKSKTASSTQKTAQQTAQQNQPSWADQYVAFRRTMHNGDTQNRNNPTNSRSRYDRQSTLTGNSSNIQRRGTISRSRTPNDTNQLPDAARKYINGY
jgi:hypothetical protein